MIESFNYFEVKDLFCCCTINYRIVGSLRGLQQTFVAKDILYMAGKKDHGEAWIT